MLGESFETALLVACESAVTAEATRAEILDHFPRHRRSTPRVVSAKDQPLPCHASGNAELQTSWYPFLTDQPGWNEPLVDLFERRDLDPRTGGLK